MRVADLTMTCVWPIIYEGRTADGRETYLRYRYGWVKVFVDDEMIFEAKLSDDSYGDISEEQVDSIFEMIPECDAGDPMLRRAEEALRGGGA